MIPLRTYAEQFISSICISTTMYKQSKEVSTTYVCSTKNENVSKKFYVKMQGNAGQYVQFYVEKTIVSTYFDNNEINPHSSELVGCYASEEI